MQRNILGMASLRGLLLMLPLALLLGLGACNKEEEALPVANTSWKSVGTSIRPWPESGMEDNVPFPEEVQFPWTEFAKGTLPGGKKNLAITEWMSENVFLRTMQGLTMEFGEEQQATAVFNVMIYRDWDTKTDGEMLTLRFPCKYYKENGMIVVRDYSYHDLGNMFAPKYAKFLALNAEDFGLVFNTIAGLIVVQSEAIISEMMGMPFKYMNGEYIISPRVQTSFISGDSEAIPKTAEELKKSKEDFAKLAKVVGPEKAKEVVDLVKQELKKNHYCLYLKKVE